MKHIVKILMTMAIIALLAVGASAITESELTANGYTDGGDITNTGYAYIDGSLPTAKKYYTAGSGFLTAEASSGSLLVTLYDATINVNTDVTTGDDNWYGIYCEDYPLIVELNGTNSITVKPDNSIGLGYGIYNDSTDITIHGNGGGSLAIAATQDGIGGKGAVTIDSCTLTLDSPFDIYLYNASTITIKDSTVTGKSYFYANQLITQNSSVLVPRFFDNYGNATILSDYTIDDYTTSSSNDLTITSGVTLTVDDGGKLKLDGDLILESGASVVNNGTILFYSDLTYDEISSLGITGTGMIYLDSTGAHYDSLGNVYNFVDTLTLRYFDDAGSCYTWDYDTQTLTLEDGFHCTDDIDFRVDGDVTVIVKGEAYVEDDFENDDPSTDITITGGGTLTVDGDIEIEHEDHDTSLTIAAGTTVITNEEMEVDNLYLYGTLEVYNDNENEAIEINDRMIVGSDATLIISQEYDEYQAIVFYNELNRPTSQLFSGMNATLAAGEDEFGTSIYFLADKSGNILYEIGVEDDNNLFGGTNFMAMIVLWRMSQRYAVDVDVEGLGTVDVAGADETDGALTAKWSTDVDFTATPADGWELSDIKVDGESVAIDNFRINNIKKNHAITFVFTEIAA
ncbi:MAG: hypothetical protein E7632_04050 [Ruminococcaceae bacterium]|nr:hypothetical protein [Oscillospiraceae bacterium]